MVSLLLVQLASVVHLRGGLGASLGGGQPAAVRVHSISAVLPAVVGGHGRQREAGQPAGGVPTVRRVVQGRRASPVVILVTFGGNVLRLWVALRARRAGWASARGA